MFLDECFGLVVFDGTAEAEACIEDRNTVDFVVKRSPAFRAITDIHRLLPFPRVHGCYLKLLGVRPKLHFFLNNLEIRVGNGVL